MPQFIPVAVTYFAASAATGYVAMALYASAAIQAVGIVTKNEDLQKLGAIVGIGAGIYGAATGAFGEAAGEVAADEAIDATVAEAAAESTGGSLATEAAQEMSYGAVQGAGSGVVNTANVAPTTNTDLAAKANVNTGAGVSAPSAPPSVGAPPPAVTPPPTNGGGGFFGGFNLKDPQTLYGTGLIMQGAGPAIAGAFSSGTEEDKLELLKQQEAARQQEAERRAENFNNISGVDLGVRPSGATLYRRPRGLMYPYRSPTLPQ